MGLNLPAFGVLLVVSLAASVKGETRFTRVCYGIPLVGNTVPCEAFGAPESRPPGSPGVRFKMICGMAGFAACAIRNVVGSYPPSLQQFLATPGLDIECEEVEAGEYTLCTILPGEIPEERLPQQPQARSLEEPEDDDDEDEDEEDDYVPHFRREVEDSFGVSPHIMKQPSPVPTAAKPLLKESNAQQTEVKTSTRRRRDTSAHHQPSADAQLNSFARSYEEPSSSYGQPDSGYEQPSSSNGQPFEQPSSAYGQPDSSFEQPSSSYGQPDSSFEQPSSSYGQPDSSFEQPSSSYGQPDSSFEQPSSSYGQPFEQPSSSYGQPDSSYEQPSSSSSSYEQQPSSSYEQPSVRYEQPSSSCGQQYNSPPRNQFGPSPGSFDEDTPPSGEFFQPGPHSDFLQFHQFQQPIPSNGPPQRQAQADFPPFDNSFGERRPGEFGRPITHRPIAMAFSNAELPTGAGFCLRSCTLPEISKQKGFDFSGLATLERQILDCIAQRKKACPLFSTPLKGISLTFGTTTPFVPDFHWGALERGQGRGTPHRWLSPSAAAIQKLCG
ncbi:unnamed protein product [Cyprideis torosa]|uniref:Uncharacterized protein n=1 Tax=Cyprideis torosa TaxID=163714 RepID=A0A7R8WK55_9CRUS|nr:unnamed protein product [Cyprideis torosa]CAG0895706.1 unnamed protein product [Cyprideis torosa]